MRIKVVYAAIDGTTLTDEFTCSHVARQQLLPNRKAVNLVFTDGRHGDKKIVTAQYSRVTALYYYED